MIRYSLARKTQRTRQGTFCIETSYYGFFHRIKDFLQKIPDFRSFTLFHIFPVAMACFLAPRHNVLDLVHLIDIATSSEHVTFGLAFRKCTTAYAIYRPLVASVSRELHAVGMERQEDLGLPDDVHWGYLTKHINDGDIGHVTFSRSSETAVKSYFEALGLGMPLGVDACCIVWPHRVTA